MNHSLDDSILSLNFEEDITSTTVKALLEEAQDIIDGDNDVAQVTLNLAEVNNIDSQGLNLIIGIYQEARSRDWQFSITGASASISRLFDFVKLSERFGIQTG